MSARAESGDAVLIGADQYPAVLAGPDAAKFLRNLANPATAQRAAQIIELRRNELCDTVLDYIQRLESAATASNLSDIFRQAHEIRGLAATAGLDAAGRIANGLCQYLDASGNQQSETDPAVIALHVDAIVRSSTAGEEARKFGGRVAVELGALVARRLGAVNAKRVKQP
jgi:chemotaxis protein histidine kinase CheA